MQKTQFNRRRLLTTVALFQTKVELIRYFGQNFESSPFVQRATESGRLQIFPEILSPNLQPTAWRCFFMVGVEDDENSCKQNIQVFVEKCLKRIP